MKFFLKKIRSSLFIMKFKGRVFNMIALSRLFFKAAGQYEFLTLGHHFNFPDLDLMP